MTMGIYIIEKKLTFRNRVGINRDFKRPKKIGKACFEDL